MAFERGQIFVYDGKAAQLRAYKDFFALRTLQMFGTDNIYKLTQYAEEIPPEIMIFNLGDNPQQTASALNWLATKSEITYPVIVLNPHNENFVPNRHIAHYLTAPFDNRKFMDIIDSYCIGNKHHQVLLLDTLTALPSPVSRQLQQHGYNFFETHTGCAANLYLSKNTPDIVCIEYSLPFILERHHLQHNRIFYVDRQQDIAEIEAFLH